MKLKNPISFFCILLFIVANILDSITTFFVLPGEANPIYLLTGSIWFLLGFKILLILTLFWYYYKNKFTSHFAYYNYILVTVTASSFLIFAAISNTYNLMTVPTEVIVAQATVAPEVKMKGYLIFSTVVYLFPYLMSLLSFHLYHKSKHCARIKEDQNEC